MAIGKWIGVCMCRAGAVSAIDADRVVGAAEAVAVKEDSSSAGEQL